jgi:transcriptional regulator with XRE-family HTH domain
MWIRALMPQKLDQDRSPNAVDSHVGSRIRARRRELHISQERLAEALGLTFQQVQKYEKAANRVSASKLFEIAAALRTSVSFFFEGLATEPGEVGGVAEEGGEFVHDFIMTPEGLELAAWFPKIKSRRQRRRILDLVKAMAEEPDSDEAQGSSR